MTVPPAGEPAVPRSRGCVVVYDSADRFRVAKLLGPEFDVYTAAELLAEEEHDDRNPDDPAPHLDPARPAPP